MRDTLTREQTDHLFSLGIPERCATNVVEVYECETRHTRYDRSFTTMDLLKIMPRWISCEREFIINGESCMIECRYVLIMMGENDKDGKPNWLVMYEDVGSDIACVHSFCYDIPDGLYDLILWLIQNKYLDPKTL